MDSVELLILARHAAEALQSATDPDAALAAGYGLLGQEPPSDRNEALAVRIIRLLIAADERRIEALNVLLGCTPPRPQGPTANTRREHAAGTDGAGADAEALRLARFVEDHAAEGWPMLPEGFPPFVLAKRKGVEWFERDLIVEERNGRRVRLAYMGRSEPAPGGTIKEVDLGALPVTARGLIDYAVEKPVVFDLVIGCEPWDIWAICCAFADQYDRILGAARRLGGRRVGVPSNLWIERLTYYPRERLIHPWIGS
jgi:hypothetical protein